MVQFGVRIPFGFGKFSYPCSQGSLTICPALGEGEPICYSRNIDVNGFLIFQPATLIIHLAAMIMTCIMIYNIKRKYTAVGRKEMVLFFYAYLANVLLDFLLMSNIVSVGSTIYSFVEAGHVAMIVVNFWILLLNGFVGFQWTEDGTSLSLWVFRISSLAIFGLVYGISLGTFLHLGFLSPKQPFLLYFTYYMFPFACFFIYVVLQVILVLNTMEDLWPLGDIFFGVIFFLLSQAILWYGSVQICQLAVHYVDGMFFSAIFSLLAVMMVYKYWDSITKEDLEFAVGDNCLAAGQQIKYEKLADAPPSTTTDFTMEHESIQTGLNPRPKSSISPAHTRSHHLFSEK